MLKLNNAHIYRIYNIIKINKSRGGGEGVEGASYLYAFLASHNFFIFRYLRLF